MATVFSPGIFSGQQFEILGGLTAAARRGGWLNSYQNRVKLEFWLEEQRQLAERAARRRGKNSPEFEDALADILVADEAETNHFGRERAAGLRGPLKFILNVT